MKKVMSMILAVLMTLCLLAGCGKGAADEPAKDGESTQEVNGTASEGMERLLRWRSGSILKTWSMSILQIL